MSNSIKIAFGIIVFNGNYVLEETLRTIYPYASQILIAEGPVAFWQQQGYTTSTDGTNELIDNFPDPEQKIKIIHSQYKEKDEQCQAYIKFLNDDIDYLWNLDSDEIFKPKDIEKLINIIEKEKYTSIGFKAFSFFGGFDNYITGFEEKCQIMRIFKIYPGSYWGKHRTPTIIHKVKNILPNKHLDYNILAKIYNIRMYHYSYVFPDQVYQKIKYYKESLNSKGVIDNYFKNIYLFWVLGNDSKKQWIEKKYNGVHEYIKEKRGNAFTAKFTGEHPKIIQDNMDKLVHKFNEQLKKYE